MISPEPISRSTTCSYREHGSHSSSRGSRRRGRVSFNQEIIVQETLHINNYTDKERSNTWYTKSDYRQIKAESLITSELFERGIIHQDCDLYCSLGLSWRQDKEQQRQFTGTSTKRRAATAVKSVKAQSLLAVLEEQAAQRGTGVADAQAISNVYTKVISQFADNSCEKIQRRRRFSITEGKRTQGIKSFSRIFKKRKQPVLQCM